jgi:hypothetical protein
MEFVVHFLEKKLDHLFKAIGTQIISQFGNPRPINHTALRRYFNPIICEKNEGLVKPKIMRKKEGRV